jgi:hypothetical protein
VKEESFAEVLYNSIFYQVFLYFLTDRQLFARHMLPIMPTIADVLIFLSQERGKASYRLISGSIPDKVAE